uniref:Fanconi anemia, complementation group D2 n=1 Tax=Gongylonema pulchrum TaxID=637853 RepID=A0A183DKQ5_9BILA
LCRQVFNSSVSLTKNYIVGALLQSVTELVEGQEDSETDASLRFSVW